MEYLRTRKEVNASRVGFISHGEGRLAAGIAAARNRNAAFVVMLGAAAIPQAENAVEGSRLSAEANGELGGKAEAQASLMRGILTIVLRESDQATLEKTLRDFLVGKVPESQIAPQLRLWTSSAFRTAMSYDPGPELKEIMCPVLALYAEKDFTVPAKLNVPAMRAALAANKAGEVEELPNALALTLAQPVAPAEVEERGEEENFCRYTGSSNSGWMRRLHDFGMLPAPGDCQSVAAMVEVCSAISGSRSLERRS